MITTVSWEKKQKKNWKVQQVKCDQKEKEHASQDNKAYLFEVFVNLKTTNENRTKSVCTQILMDK